LVFLLDNVFHQRQGVSKAIACIEDSLKPAI